MNSTIKYSFIENGAFIVFEDGRVFKRLDPPVSSGGYKFVRIGDKSYPLHRVIASAFIPNPQNKPEVNHIDGNKENNSVSNLEWVTRKENACHAGEHGLLGRKRRYIDQETARKHRHDGVLKRPANKDAPTCGMNNLRFYRTKAGLTQTDLAFALGVNQAAISLWESGKTAPTLANLIQIAETLHVSINDLVDDD